MPAFEVETGGHDEKSGERIQITRLTRRHSAIVCGHDLGVAGGPR